MRSLSGRPHVILRPHNGLIVVFSGRGGGRAGQHLHHMAVHKHHPPAGLGVQCLQHRRRIQSWQPVGGVGKVAVVTQQLGNPDTSDAARRQGFSAPAPARPGRRPASCGRRTAGSRIIAPTSCPYLAGHRQWCAQIHHSCCRHNRCRTLPSRRPMAARSTCWRDAGPCAAHRRRETRPDRHSRVAARGVTVVAIPGKPPQVLRTCER